jgi:hypothetical protein
MQNLIEKIAAYKNATQSLIDKTELFENFIKTEVPFELWNKFSIKQCGNGRHEEYHIKIDGKIIPGVTNKLGKGLYWCGDFNHWYDYVTGAELINWCKKLPELIKKAQETIENLTSESQSISLS